MVSIYVINGYPQSGKDTFVEFCKEIRPLDTLNLVTSTPAKKALKELGWNGKEKSPTVRKALSEIMEISEKAFDGPFNWVKRKISEFKLNHPKDGVIFIHSREPRNISRYCRYFKAKSIFIQRDECKKPYGNPSDSFVENFTYDIVVVNNGTLAELRATAQEFLAREAN